MKYDRPTRCLHAGIALLVANQVFSGQLMEVPKPGRGLAGFPHDFFLVHEWSGMAAAALIVLHWLWGFMGHVSGGWGQLFPWSPHRLPNLLSDLRSIPGWIRGGIPIQQEETTALAGAIHGLGLLVVTCMAATGGTIFFGMGADGSMSSFVAAVREAHGFIANFLFAYLFGHVGMAVLHQWLGHNLLTRMFNLVER